MWHFHFSAFVNSTTKFWFAILCGQAQKFKKRGGHRIFDIPKNSDCKLVSVLEVFLGIYRNFWNNLLLKHVQTVPPHSHGWLKCFMGECGKECRSNKGQINEFFLYPVTIFAFTFSLALFHTLLHQGDFYHGFLNKIAKHQLCYTFGTLWNLLKVFSKCEIFCYDAQERSKP